MKNGSLATICVAIGLVTGCGSSEDGYPIAPAEATILLDEKPLEGASVTFVVGSQPQPATGITDKQGKVKLTTFKPGDGAAIGSNLVSIQKNEIDKTKKTADQGDQDSEKYDPLVMGTPPPVVKFLVPQKYTLVTTSGLTAEVKKGQNTFEFKLDSKAK